jgi:hypothetical protein
MARRILCIALILAVIQAAVIPPPVLACGPFFPQATFIPRLHPDFPLVKFAAGELGVLQPTYARSYLVVAYRDLSGKPLDEAERNSVVAMWNRRMHYSLPYLNDSRRDPAAQWVLARRKYTHGKDAAYIDRYRKQFGNPSISWQYFSYENCLEDAFRTAARTLHRRAAQFGARSDAVESWISAQDIVFQYCGWSDEKGAAELPKPLPASAPPLLQSDRRYQTASIHFYSGDFAAAGNEFSAIAADSNSVWHGLAALLVARSFIRKATLKDSGKEQTQDLLAADEQLQRILSDDNQRAVHPSAQRLRGFIDYRLRPEQRYAELADQLTNKLHLESLGDAIGDYTLFLDKFLGDPSDSDLGDQPKMFATGYMKSEAQRQRSDLTDWIATFESSGKAAAGHALSRWKENRTLPWLIAAMSKANGHSSEYSSLLAASASVKELSPAYAMVVFHRNRLLAEAGKSEEARKSLDAFLGERRGSLPPSAANLMIALRMKLARNLDEWVTYATRVPAMISTGEFAEEYPATPQDVKEIVTYEGSGESAGRIRDLWTDRLSGRPRFDADAAIALTEKMPLAVLATIVDKPMLPDPLRANVAQAAWVRAILLDRRDAAVALAPAMKQSFPERIREIEAYVSASSTEEQRFAGSLAILKSPGWHPYVETGLGRDSLDFTRIDNYKDNWWCALRQSEKTDWSYEDYYRRSGKIRHPMSSVYPNGVIDSPAFLDDASRAEASKEWDELGGTAAAVQALGKPVLAWAESHRDDPRVPEALHYVSRADRYGCEEKTEKNYSKMAFTLLHKRYPTNEWTKKTPFWF